MVADTRSFGGGWTPFALVAGAAGTITPPVPCNVDFGEAFVHNITQAEIRAITSFTKDSNDLVTLITMDTTSWLVTDRFCIVMSATSTNHSNMLTALNAIDGIDDIVMGVPNMKDPKSLIINAQFFTASFSFDDITVRSFSPIVKITGVEVEFTSPGVSGLIMEDCIISSFGRWQSLAHVIKYRRCAFIGQGVNGIWLFARTSLDAGTVITLESCIIGASRGIGIRQQSTVSSVFAFHCMDVGSNLSYDASAAPFTVNGCVSLARATGFSGSFQGASNHNWSTDATAPGANSLINRAVDDAKLIIFEDPAAIPDNNVLPFMAYFPKSGSEWKGAATFLSGVDRRDFFGFLRPTTGVWTMGPINLETTNGGVAFPGYGGGVAGGPVRRVGGVLAR